jgi:D-arabinose 5-phosphate isomerase GutQ
MSILSTTTKLQDALWQFYQMMEVQPVDRARALVECSPLVTTGVGKSGYVARKVASTFATYGHPARFLHPTEAGHGEIAALKDETVLMFSESGRTKELFPLAGDGTRVVLVSASASPELPHDVLLRIPDLREEVPVITPILMLLVRDGLATSLKRMHFHHPLGAKGSSSPQLSPRGLRKSPTFHVVGPRSTT